MQTCTAVWLGFKTTDTSRGCTCDDVRLLPLLFSADLRTTSPLQAHTPHTSTWHLICCIPAVFSNLHSKRDEKSHRGGGWQRRNALALMKMLQKIKPSLLQLTAFRDVITVPVLVAVHSRVSSYRLIPYENKQVPRCHFPYCTLTPAGILCQRDKQSPDTLQDLSEQKKHRKRSGTCHISLPRNYSAPYVSGWG